MRKMNSNIFSIAKLSVFAAAVFSASSALHARTYTIGQNNTTSTYGENIHFSFGSDSSRQNATIENAYWNGERTPVYVIFSKGSEAGQTGEFYFTTLYVYGDHEYGSGPDKSVNSSLTLRDGVKLNMSGSTTVTGVFSATNAEVSTTYLNVYAYGHFNMDGGSLTLTGTSTPYTYKISGEMNLNNVVFTANDKVLIDGGRFGNDGVSINDANVVFSGNTSFTGTSLLVENTNKLSLLNSASVKVDSLSASNLSVSQNARVSVSSASDLSVDNLNIILDDISPVSFADIFSASDGTSIVFSAETTNISVMNSSGEVYNDVDFAYDGDGNIIGISEVPEPSALSAIIGSLALIFALRRRR